MKPWLLRIAVLMAIPFALAVVDSNKRPIPEAALKPAAPAPMAENGAPAPAVEDQLTIEQITQHYNDGTALFVDARPKAEFDAGHIESAFHLPPEAFRGGDLSALEILPREELIIIYCGGGECDASHNVERLMRAHGYTNLKIFEPGFPAWQAAGLPISTN